jgi:hypothetical protein
MLGPIFGQNENDFFQHKLDQLRLSLALCTLYFSSHLLTIGSVSTLLFFLILV